MKGAEMESDKVTFCTDNQCVSLQTREMDSMTVAPIAPRMPRLRLATLAFIAVIVVFFLVALFVVALQPRSPALEERPSFQEFQAMFLGDNTTGQSPVEPNNHHYFGRAAEVQEVIQMFRGHMESSRTWHEEIQMLNFRVDNVSSQIQMLGGHLGDARADIQMVKGALKDTNTLGLQTQTLRSSLERADTEIERLKGSLQSANALNTQAQTFLQGSLDNISAEMQVLRGHLERAGDEIHVLKRDLETVTAQTQIANGHLEQTDAQIQELKAELENASTLNAQIQVLNGQLKNASREIQTLKQGVKDAAALNSQTQMLESNLQKASTEMQRLKGDLENTKTLTTKIQEEQSRLRNLFATLASQEQQQSSQNQLLQLILKGWKVYAGNLYYFSHVKKSWHEAENSCVSMGAHLASVTSQDEQTFLVYFTKNSYHWIGLTDMGTEGSWRWTDGTQFDKAQSRAFWDKNQPDNWRHRNGQTEDCVHLQQLWNDIDCNSLYYWVCKRPMDQRVAGQS
ncbi:C-type lectin domain family 4 member F [Sciurus carolinensis]|uniref:C-type lectin domain family 4 member F n=1 Tax=Sciurus carolinensis TaxID=30640 RepID=UPI001FB4A005|nr:C-type lectin domain family 4 member F [Sciurus carolinensis]